MFVHALAAPEAERLGAVQRMFAPEETWHCRLLGLRAMEMTGIAVDRQKAIAEQVVAKEAPGFVKDYAVATLKLLNQPQTQPAKAPAGPQPTRAP